MYNKTIIIELGFRMISWIIKTSCLCYLPKPKAEFTRYDLSARGVGAQILRVFWQPMNDRFMGMKIGPIKKSVALQQIFLSRANTQRETTKSIKGYASG